MGSFLSDTFFKSFSSIVNRFVSIFMIQVLHNITNTKISMISAETAGEFIIIC
jgi:hypothetical protein